MKITLIHAVEIAIQPVKTAFENEWPEAEITHLWDETLSLERAKQTELTPFLFERVAELYALAKSGGADAVMFTCSAFGEAIEKLAETADIPVLKPNQAMFEYALSIGKPVALLGSFAPAMQGMVNEFVEAASEQGLSANIEQVCVTQARTALQQGNHQQHHQLMLQATQSLQGIDVVMLAHFSSSGAKSLLESETKKTVLSSPECAVRYLKNILLPLGK